MSPLASLTVPSSEGCTPRPAFAVVTPLVSSVSGQAWVQPFAWVQVIVPPFSEVSMYRVWPCPLTRTVPTPGTLFAPIVAEAADEAPAGPLLPGEPTAVLEVDEPHAAIVAAVPSARPLASSQLLSGPRRCLALFLPIVLSISIFLTPFRSVQAADCLRISHTPDRSVVSEADRRRWCRPSGLSRGLFLGSPLVPDISQQRAVAGQMAGDTAKVVPPSIVCLVASLPKRLVSHLLADGQSESVAEGPLQGAIALPCSALVPRAGFRSPHCL